MQFIVSLSCASSSRLSGLVAAGLHRPMHVYKMDRPCFLRCSTDVPIGHSLWRHAVILAGAPRGFSPEAFSGFRSCLVKTAAEAFARAGAIPQLETLLQRHALVLMPSLLDVLACLPETISPSAFEHLLPKVTAAESATPGSCHAQASRLVDFDARQLRGHGSAFVCVCDVMPTEAGAHHSSDIAGLHGGLLLVSSSPCTAWWACEAVRSS